MTTKWATLQLDATTQNLRTFAARARRLQNALRMWFDLNVGPALAESSRATVRRLVLLNVDALVVSMDRTAADVDTETKRQRAEPDGHGKRLCELARTADDQIRRFEKLERVIGEWIGNQQRKDETP